MKYVLLILTITLVISLYFNINYYSESQTFKSKEDDFQRKLNIYKRKLEEQSRERMVLVDSISSIDSTNQVLISNIEQTRQELKSIKGRYKNYKPSELSELMEQRVH